MGFLAGKRVLITGLLSNRSIAYGIATAMQREDATLAFTYQGEGVKDRVLKLAAEFGSDIVLPCDVASDEEIAKLFADLGARWDGLDGIIHSIAFAPREALAGAYLDGLTRDAFRVAHEVSSYSFAALAKAALPMMQGRQAALLTNLLVAKHVPLLGIAVPHIGHIQTRSRGTVGGSLAHADPSAELPLVMKTLDATFTLRSSISA